jgi:hypothetical protein
MTSALQLEPAGRLECQRWRGSWTQFGPLLPFHLQNHM